MKTIYLSLGSNLGDREGRLREALVRLEAAEIHVLRRSRIYETEPQDVHDQPWFLNLVVEAETLLYPMQLLDRTQHIENELGRKRLKPKGPRSIDIDILLYGNAVIKSSRLEIPHPRFHERRFVLEPLADLVPDLRHPLNRKTVREMLSDTHDQTVRPAGITW